MGQDKFELFFRLAVQRQLLNMKTKDDVLRQAVKFRGLILNEVVVLERLMDLFIAKHFCWDDEDKQEEMMTLILSKDIMTFSQKQEIANIILRDHFPQIMSDNKFLLTDLETIKKYRNILAHYLLNNSDMALEQPDNQIELIKYKSEVKKRPTVTGVEITETLINDLWQKIYYISVIFQQLCKISEAPNAPTN